MTFIPNYDAGEASNMFLRWLDGSLDSIHSEGLPIAGVEGVNRRAWGLKAERLAERFVSSEIQVVIQSLMAEPEPHPTYGLLLFSVWGKGFSVSDIAKAMSMSDDSQAQSVLVNAIDEFMRRLLSRSRILQSESLSKPEEIPL